MGDSLGGPDAIGPSIQPTILVADLDRSTAELCREIFPNEELQIVCAASADELLQALESGSGEILVLSQELPNDGGPQLLEHLRYWHPQIQVIVVSEHPTYSFAVRAIKLGAFDYLPKPLEAVLLRHTIERAMEEHTFETGKRSPTSGPAKGAFGLIGQTPAMMKLYRMIAKVAAGTHPVLILGESGTGKELVARAIHFHGPRRQRPFLPIDCGALVPTLMESELFGHERGAFTGAERSRDGLLRLAEGGTAFFDEIGELTFELQAKLLRALQEKEIRPVGSTKRMPIDVRIIAATNRRLEEDARQGRFRKDLLFRLNVVTIRVPPLRDRIDDLEDLTTAFLDRIAVKGSSPKQLSKPAMRMLKSYSWPGNVRELENALERAVIIASADLLQPIDFPSHIASHTRDDDPNPAQSTSKRVQPLAEVERHAILHAMSEAKGDKQLAAQMLGIGKTTLYRKLREYAAGS